MAGLYYVQYGIIDEVRYDESKNIIAPNAQRAAEVAYALAVSHYDDVVNHRNDYYANTVDYYYETMIDHLVELHVDLRELSNSQLDELMRSAIQRYCDEREDKIFYKVKEV